MRVRWSTACQFALAIALLSVRAVIAEDAELPEFPIAEPVWFEAGASHDGARLGRRPPPNPPSERGGEESSASPAKGGSGGVPASWTEPFQAHYEPPFVAPRAQDCYSWQVMPPGLMYRSYLAGEKEPRFQFVFLSEKNRGMVWETALGGRIGILRHGTCGAVNPEGWQLDFEGAALPRVDPEQRDDLEAVDFRVGWVSTWRRGPNAYKAGYYHISSHVGDEFLIANPGFQRHNYVRDSFIAGWTHDVTPDTQIYGEIGYAFNCNGGAEPLELQFGTQYSPVWETTTRGAPFAAFNVHSREEYNFETSINLVAGWQWRGAQTDHRFRAGLQYYNGPSIQWSFLNQYESLFGGGFWCDY